MFSPHFLASEQEVSQSVAVLQQKDRSSCRVTAEEHAFCEVEL